MWGPARVGGSAAGVEMATSSGVGELVRAAAAGDRRARDELVDRYSGLLWATPTAIRLGRADAADVVQTVWLRLLENLERLRDPDRVGGRPGPDAGGRGPAAAAPHPPGA